MRCAICDKALSESEIQFTPDSKTFEPCSVCIEIIMDTAYCDGFTKEDPLDDPELDDLYGSGTVETLDSDIYTSVIDKTDITYSFHPYGED